MKLIGRVLLIGVFWVIAWGVCGLGIAVVGIATSPDTGHVPHGLVATIVSFVSAAVGFFSGIVYGFISGTVFLRARARMLTGAVVGASGIIALVIIGAITNTSSAEPFVSTFREGVKGLLIFSPIAAVLGGSLGAIDAKWQKQKLILHKDL